MFNFSFFYIRDSPGLPDEATTFRIPVFQAVLQKNPSPAVPVEKKNARTFFMSLAQI